MPIQLRSDDTADEHVLYQQVMREGMSLTPLWAVEHIVRTQINDKLADERLSKRVERLITRTFQRLAPHRSIQEFANIFEHVRNQLACAVIEDIRRLQRITANGSN